MTLPALPALDSTNWYPWAEAVHTQVNAVKDRAIRVADYGTLGTGDDSATINAALADAAGRRLIFPPNATLNTGQTTLNGVSNTIIDGNGCTLQLIATGARIAGLNITGVCDHVEVRNLGVKGNGLVVDHHAGISSSGATLTDVRVIGCLIRDVTLGIGFSADGAGSIRGLLYESNEIRNVVGTASGDGYGLHVAVSDTVVPAGVRMIGNTVRSAQRHSIYCAKGRGVTIMGNQIIDHRDANKDGNIRAALVVARSADVSVIGNTISRPAGGAMQLGGPAPSTIAGPYVVLGNTMSDPQDAASLVYVGQQDPLNEGIPAGAIFAYNHLTAATLTGLMTVWNGKQLSIVGNRFKLPTGSTATALTLQGLGQTTNEYMDDVEVADNLFDVDANTAIRLSAGHEDDTTKYRFRGNRRTTTHNIFTLSAAASNPNIDVQDQVRTGLSFTGTTSVKPFLGGPVQLTSPTAGSAGALPAAPGGYLTLNVNGIDVRVAYY